MNCRGRRFPWQKLSEGDDAFEAAIRAGNLRQDFDIQKDLILLISMLGVSLISVEVSERKAHAKRALQLLLKGPAEDLPASPFRIGED